MNFKEKGNLNLQKAVPPQYINYIVNNDLGMEMIFYNLGERGKITTICNGDNSIIMKKGKFLLLFLNADFSDDDSAINSFYSYLPKELSNQLMILSPNHESNDFKERLLDCMENVFGYSLNCKVNYKEQFKSYITENMDFLLPTDRYGNIMKLIDVNLTENFHLLSNNDFINNSNNIYDVYSLKTLRELIYIMLKEYIFSNSMPIKICKNCGKFFIAQNRIDEIYCNNLVEGTGKTCKEIGPKITFAQKNMNHSVLIKYRNILNKKDMRVRRNKNATLETYKDFSIWKNAAKIQLEKYKNKEITDIEFEKWLDENDN